MQVQCLRPDPLDDQKSPIAILSAQAVTCEELKVKELVLVLVAVGQLVGLIPVLVGGLPGMVSGKGVIVM